LTEEVQKFMNNNKNDILKKYIIDKYGSIAKFLRKEKFPPYSLETVFQKNDIFYEMGIGINICRVLNIDAGKLFCHEEIVELGNGKSNDTGSSFSMDDIIKEKYANLNADERKRVSDYTDYIFENGGGE